MDQSKLTQKLNDYLNKLNHQYTQANSISKLKSITRDLIDFQDICQEIGIENQNIKWLNDNRITQLYDQILINSENSILNDIETNNQIFNLLSTNTLKTFQKSNLKFKNSYTIYSELPRINLSEIIDIISSFLNDFDYNAYLAFKSQLDNNEIHLTNLQQGCCGDTLNLITINKFLVLIDKRIKNNLYLAFAIIHEFGHTQGITLLNNESSKINLKTLDSLYSEIISNFYECAFVNYLIDNKIHLKSTEFLSESRYNELLTHMASIKLMTDYYSKKQHYNLYDGVFIPDDISLINKINKIKHQTRLYHYDETSVPFYFITPFIYGLGSLISLSLYENYQTNPDFSKNLTTFLSSYPMTNDLSIFEQFGITKENLISSKVLSKNLDKHIQTFQTK